MSDSKISKQPSDETPWSDALADALADSLLRETAEGGAADEAFLASVENAIDAESDSAAEIVPIAEPNSRNPWIWSSGIAAALVIGLGVWYLNFKTAPGVGEPTPELASVPPKAASAEKNPEKIEPDPEIAATSVSGEKQQYLIELQERVKKADEFALRGSHLMAESDYQGAIDQYRAALDFLPEASITEPRQKAYVKQFSRASVILARERAEEGRYPESIALIAEVLQPSVDPDNVGAKHLLESLDDPARYSLTTSHLERVRKVKLALKTGQGYLELGDFDRAEREFHKTLNEDPYNVAARRISEEAERYRMDYYDAAYDHTRARMLSEIAKGWESPIPSGQVDGLTIATAPQPNELAEAGDGGIPSLAAKQHGGTIRIGGGLQGSNVSLATVTPPSSGTDTLERSRGRNVAAIGHGGSSFATELEPTAGTATANAGDEIALGLDSSNPVSLAEPIVGKPTEGKMLSFTESDSLVTDLAGVGRAFHSTARPAYAPLVDNPWFSPLDEPLSTFSTDVDTASWTNLRAMIREGRSADAIPNDAVRIEELINYFEWDYPQPDGKHPFAFATETAECPWNEDHRLVRVGIQGREIPRTERPDANLVFLLDVSGSMNKPNKLPLVKRAISVLVEELEEHDTVSIVVYAGAEGLALRSTSGRDQITIREALEKLDAGGSTNGGAGIKLAYKMAREQFIEDGINRVILCTDGDFNVGTTGTEELVSLVEKEAESGVFLSVCGFGQDNLNDAMLEDITNKGNGNYAYIDGFREARKVFLQDLMGTLVTIAKDVKIQIEFNPAQVDGYRLIGYANRKLEAEDFENDEIDAGEVGAGHAVTALYEIVPAGAKKNPADDEIGLRYQKKDRPTPKRNLIPSGELALLKLRYKQPDGEKSILMEQPVMPSGKKWKRASEDFRFASAVGLFGLILREHESVGETSLGDVIEIASNAKGPDSQGWRAEFVDLVRQLDDREPAPVVSPEIRAVVDGESISQSMVDESIRLQVKVWLMGRRGIVSKDEAENHIRQIEKDAVDDLIDRRLILDEFKRLGGQIKEKFIDHAVARFVEKHFDGNHEKFEADLRKSDMTVADFRKFQRDNIAVEALKSEHSNPDATNNDSSAKEGAGSWIGKLRNDAGVKLFP